MQKYVKVCISFGYHRAKHALNFIYLYIPVAVLRWCPKILNGFVIK